MSKGNHIGELEELILLLVGVLRDEASALGVLQEMKSQTGRVLNISAVHAVLNRLEEKGYVSSEMGGATQERGGRRMRFYTLTAAGRQMIDQVRSVREKLYGQLGTTSLYTFS